LARRLNSKKKDKEKQKARRRRLAAATLLLVLFFGSALGAYFLYRYIPFSSIGFIARIAPVKNILIEGTHRLSKAEVAELIDISDLNMFSLNPKELRQDLKSFPWIRDAKIRKEFPSTVRIFINEREPVALLQNKRGFYFLDSNGRIIEKLASTKIPFLPVITDVRQEPVAAAAMDLVRVLGDIGVIEMGKSVEISVKDPKCLVMHIGGLVVKMGNDNFPEKLDRWFGIEAEIAKRRIDVDYVDLRFANKVIVRPLTASHRRLAKS